MDNVRLMDGTSSSLGDEAARRPKAKNYGSQESRCLQLSKLSCLQCRNRKVKCNRVRPACEKCSKLGSECTYPGSRQKPVSRRQNVQALQARLVELEETMKGIQSGKSQAGQLLPDEGRPVIPDWSLFDVGVDMSPAEATPLQPVMPTGESAHVLEENAAEDQLMWLGLFEQMPSLQLIDDLTTIYFDKLHHAAPMLHRDRYMASLHLPQHRQPPMCLQYIVMASAAGTDSTYSHMAMPFYRHARNYAEADEMKEQGDHFCTVAHAQCWALMANFEAQRQMFTRASVSLSRSLRIAQMLGLHRLDKPSQSMPPALPEPKDWCELEERRRTWWVIFCSDRFVSGVGGWPTLIDDRDIYTLLPASEQAFDTAAEEETSSLTGSLSPGASGYSPFAGRALAAHSFHRTIEHTRKTHPDDEPENTKNGPFWNRHRRLDNDLVAMLMFLPDSLRLSRSSRCLNAIFVNIIIQAGIICLHREAVAKAEQLNLPQHIIQQSTDRLLRAAEDILRILKATTEIDLALKNPLIAFSAYVAAAVFLDDFMVEPNKQSEDNLDFLLNIMTTVGQRNLIARSLAVQLSTDMKRIGIDSSAMQKINGMPLTSVAVPILAKRNTASPQITFCQPPTRSADAGGFDDISTSEIPVPHQFPDMTDHGTMWL